MAAFLRRHAYRGGKIPTGLLERLRWAPTPPTGLPPQVLAHLLGVQIVNPLESWRVQLCGFGVAELCHESFVVVG